MVSVKHKFSSTKADSVDASVVKPSNWNAEHDMVTSTAGIVLGRLAADGPGPVQELPLTAFLPPGIILAWAGITVPAGGWYACDGTVRAIEGNEALYAVVGNAFGGVPASTFAVPDLRGRVIAGMDVTGIRLGSPWVDPDGGTRGATGGEQADNLNLKQIPSHTHAHVLTDPKHEHDLSDPLDIAERGNVGGGSGGTPIMFDTSHTPKLTALEVETGITLEIKNAGGDPAADPPNSTALTSRMQPTMVLQYVIKR